MFDTDEVLEGLQKSLAMFGEIVDLGIYTEKASGYFMGTGYAVLNTSTSQNYVELSHLISWCESDKEFFHATWSNMPTWCRYCHKEGHTKFSCPLARARTLCYSCHEQGHRSYECPRRNNSKASNKKQDRKSYLNNQSTTNSQKDELEFAPATPVIEASQDGVAEDNMSTSGDSVSEVDEDEQIFRDNVENLKADLDSYSPDDIKGVIREVSEANEIVSSTDSTSTPGTLIWTVVKRTERAEALVGWLNHNKFAYLAQSPSITHRRPSQLTFGDFVPNQPNQL
jgi:hypothetical protein